ncbi:MAG: hypothetical protein ABSC51_03670 [Gaiellaceae bacterium]
MTSSLGRLYATAFGLVIFFVAWAVVAARPWVSVGEAKTDPRLATLKVREQRLRRDAVAIKAIVDKRWAIYRVELANRRHLIAVRAQQAAAARRQAQTQVAQARPYRPAQSAQSASTPRVPAPVVRVTPAAPATPTRTS